MKGLKHESFMSLSGRTYQKEGGNTALPKPKPKPKTRCGKRKETLVYIYACQTLTRVPTTHPRMPDMLEEPLECLTWLRDAVLKDLQEAKMWPIKMASMQHQQSLSDSSKNIPFIDG